MGKQDTIENLTYQLYGLASMRRDMWRRAGFEQAHVPLLNLVRVSGPVRVSAVAEELHVDVSVASRQLGALEERGYVERTVDPDDGRSRLIAITEEGEATLAEAHRRMLDVVATTLDDWKTAEVDALAAGMERMQDAYTDAVRAELVGAGTKTTTGAAQPATAFAGGAR